MSGSTTSRAGIPWPADEAVHAVVRAWADTGAHRDPAAVLAAAVARVADTLGVEVALEVDGSPVAPDPAVLGAAVDPTVLEEAGPWLPGFLREALVDQVSRSVGGVHHTDPAVADAVIEVALGVVPLTAGDVVLDPAVGGGAFLLAAAARMPGTRAEIARRLRGVDVDPLAVGVARAAVRLWAGGAPVADGAFATADGLELVDGGGATWIVGNPPFLSQLKGGTVRDRERHARLRRRWPELAAYTDDAAAFLLAAVDLVAAGGVVALIQPTSVLAARDGRGVRERLAAVAPPAAIWIDDDRRFVAAVDTVALVHRVGGAAGPVARAVGVPPVGRSAVDVDAGTWAPLLVDGTVAPPTIADLRTAGTVGDVAVVTAGFRDEYYGLRRAVEEDPDAPIRLITSGLIDPLDDRWGRAPCRFDKRRWSHPAVVPDRVDPAVGDWVAARLRPKLLLASQTKALEVLVDRDGTTVPCTPVVSIEPGTGAPSLTHLAAALTAPVVTALLLRASAGSALSRDAMRVRAATVAGLPLPHPGPAWDAAAALVERRLDGDTTVTVGEVGAAADLAYGMEPDADLHKWWHSRLPRR